MIITINEKNTPEYNALFAKAYQHLLEKQLLRAPFRPEDGYKGGRFKNIQDYFTHMEELSILDDKYVMLPLDDDSESPFRINANTRNISTPKITVLQDDQNAEVIIFEIDRYFDYKDLNETNIWVQWTAPGPNGTVREGASEVELRDLSIPGKMRLGWFVDSDITAYPGTVKYSVRFWHQENINGVDTVVYSFNTATSSFTVTPSLQHLNVDADVNAPIRDSIFRKAIRNSQIATEGVAIPLTPSFGAPGKDLDSTATLNKDTLTLEAQAIIGDGGYIEYEWYYKPAVDMPDLGMNSKTFYPFDDVTEVNSEGETVVVVEGFGAKVHGNKVTEAKKDKYVKYDYSSRGLVPGDQYYTKAADDSIGWLPYTSTLTPEDGTELYERYTTYTVPATGVVTGAYKVCATNTIGFNTSHVQPSTTCRLISPDNVVFSTDLLESAVIKDEEVGINLNVGLVPQTESNAQITYTWKRSIKSNVIDEDDETVNNENSNSCTIKAPGWYQVTADALLNREDKSATSKICKVTFMPKVPSLDYTEQAKLLIPDDKEIPYYGSDEATLEVVVIGSVKPEEYANYADELFSDNDELTFTWYVQSNEGATRLVTDADIESGLVKSSLGTSKLTVYSPGHEGYTFTCKVSNTLNGETVDSGDSSLAFYLV